MIIRGGEPPIWEKAVVDDMSWDNASSFDYLGYGSYNTDNGVADKLHKFVQRYERDHQLSL